MRWKSTSKDFENSDIQASKTHAFFRTALAECQPASAARRRPGVFLSHSTLVRSGDVLLVEDGSMVRVIAAPQAVLRITAGTANGSLFDLTRAAYQLGRRHMPIELKPDHLKIEPNPVLADMLRAMHLTVEAVDKAFEPQGSFYSAESHAHTHAQVVDAKPQAAHVHGPDCNHGHGGHDHNHTPQAVQPVAIQIHPRKPHSGSTTPGMARSNHPTSVKRSGWPCSLVAGGFF